MQEEISIPEERGTVTIPVSRYEKLIEQSKEKAPYTVVQKSRSQIADDNQVWGVIFMFGGATLGVIGAAMHWLGRKQEQALERELAE